MIGELQRFKADYLKAMAHPVRIRVLELLREGELSVAEVQARLDPQVANTSQHLAVLRGAGIVTARKTGLSVMCAVRDPQVFVMLDALREVFSQRLDSMQTVLATDDAGPTPKRSARARRAPGVSGGGGTPPLHACPRCSWPPCPRTRCRRPPASGDPPARSAPRSPSSAL